MDQRFDVTVAAVVERHGRFLIVEEVVAGCHVLNQPAGHVEHGESLIDAVVRETREETGYRFEPRHLLGVYLWTQCESNRSFLRIAFCGPAAAPDETPDLDDGIVAVHWLSPAQLLQRKARLRSPLVAHCIAAYQDGVRFPLDALVHLTPDVDAIAALA